MMARAQNTCFLKYLQAFDTKRSITTLETTQNIRFVHIIC